ncbi:hypothetical protein NDU88_003331 [Pleurodeles waltl]|uniref:Uncharacterized protein n=1 Tax=Pleurodeles waltl TaxID=8319 RepID=A0AAV7W5A1_PLEWA|nr:hypothetical protein NDU88_003331 [Pleurodeles waltl]
MRTRGPCMSGDRGSSSRGAGLWVEVALSLTRGRRFSAQVDFWGTGGAASSFFLVLGGELPCLLGVRTLGEECFEESWLMVPYCTQVRAEKLVAVEGPPLNLSSHTRRLIKGKVVFHKYSAAAVKGGASVESRWSGKNEGPKIRVEQGEDGKNSGKKTDIDSPGNQQVFSDADMNETNKESSHAQLRITRFERPRVASSLHSFFKVLLQGDGALEGNAVLSLPTRDTDSKTQMVEKCQEKPEIFEPGFLKIPVPDEHKGIPRIPF